MDFSITNNIGAVSRGLGKLARKQIPFATVQTLNQLAFEAMKKEKEMAPRELDRPTPYTKSGFKYKRANKRTLESLMFIPDSGVGESRDYMRLAIFGGIALPDGKALTHPTVNTRLNRYGNITRNYVSQSLAKKAKFFSGVPRGIVGEQNAGLWERYGGRKSPKIKMVVHYRNSRRYTAKFPFYEIAGNVIKMRSNKIFNEQFNRAMLSAR